MRVSHLFFGDNLLLFAEATPEQAGCIRDGLLSICRASGQKVSYDKSMLLVYPNIEMQAAVELSTKLGIPLTLELGRYLGHHLIYKGRSGSRQCTLLEKVKGKLEGWKSSCLSRAGRLTLAKSVLSNMVAFTCSVKDCQRRITKTSTN